MKMKVTVICPVYNEGAYIKTFLSSLLNQDFPENEIEYLIIDGMSIDGSLGYINDHCTKYTNFKLISNPKKYVPYALNLGVQNASGDIIVRLDAHASYPKEYISTLVYWLEELKADNVGCPLETDVLNRNPKTIAIKTLLSSTFGVGNSLFRTGVNSVREVDTVPFGCFKRDVFDKIGLFNCKLTRNQDIEFNKRLKQAGGRIFLIPFIKCKYFARESFSKLAYNNYQNGLWNMLTIYYTNNLKSISIRHIVPMLFISSLVIPILLVFISPYFAYLTLASLTLYLIFVLINVLKFIKQCNPFYLAYSFFLMHFSYGLGSVVGVFNLIKFLFRNEK